MFTIKVPITNAQIVCVCIFRKHRLPHRVHDAHVDRMQRRLAVEERNMLLLRHPYLTLVRKHCGFREDNAIRLPSLIYSQEFKELTASTRYTDSSNASRETSVGLLTSVGKCER